MALLDPINSGAEPNDAPTEPLPANIVTLDSLPIVFKGWTLDRRPEGDGRHECFLRSSNVDFFDGYESSKLSLEVRSDRVIVSTDSQIDLSYPDVGLKIGERGLLAFVGPVEKTRVEVRGNLIQELGRAQDLTVYLGFWPTWPVTKTQAIPVSLDGVRAGLSGLATCGTL